MLIRRRPRPIPGVADLSESTCALRPGRTGYCGVVVADSTLIVSIVGIAVSGVVGPVVTVWATRASARRQFMRDREDRRRHELLGLLDEAAAVLGLGAVRLRQGREQRSEPTEEVRLWPEQVYALSQRLQLRLGAGHSVVTAYDSVRSELVNAGKVGVQDPAHEEAILRFEDARGRFLAASLSVLNAPIQDKDPKT